MEMETLRDLYVEELKDLYSAEKQIARALGRLSRAARNDELRSAIEVHLDQTLRQAERLERICEGLDEKPTGKKCAGMEGILEEARELLQERPAPEVLDAGIIAAMQHVEHYEIAGYGCVRTYARLLGREEDVQLLAETLEEEKRTDELLTALAEQVINLQAAAAEGEGAEDEDTARPSRGRGASKKGGARKMGARKTGARKTGARKQTAAKGGARKAGARKQSAAKGGVRKTGARKTSARKTGGTRRGR
jgi:ferritin-like metal-binding protein YciE